MKENDFACRLSVTDPDLVLCVLRVLCVAGDVLVPEVIGATRFGCCHWVQQWWPRSERRVSRSVAAVSLRSGLFVQAGLKCCANWVCACLVRPP